MSNNVNFSPFIYQPTDLTIIVNGVEGNYFNSGEMVRVNTPKGLYTVYRCAQGEVILSKDVRADGTVTINTTSNSNLHKALGLEWSIERNGSVSTLNTFSIFYKTSPLLVAEYKIEDPSDFVYNSARSGSEPLPRSWKLILTNMEPALNA